MIGREGVPESNAFQAAEQAGEMLVDCERFRQRRCCSIR
jgi:hypothetical protein